MKPKKTIFLKEEFLVSTTNYPYYPQPVRPTTPTYMEPINQFMGIKGRPVSSIEEARAMSIDFDGSIFYFPDLANRRIYTKQINMDGTSTLNVYEFKELPPPATTTNYVTREEFEAVIEQLKQTCGQPAQPVGQAAPPQMKF